MSTGFILLIDEEQRADHLIARIEEDGRFTDALSIADWSFGERSIALIGFDRQHLQYAAIARRGRRVATLKFQVEFTDFVDLELVSLQEVEREVRSSIRPHFVRVTSGHGRPVPQKTWQSILLAIRKLRPGISDEIDRLEHLAATREWRPLDPRREQLAQEKDAFLLARQIFGLDPRRNPVEWGMSGGELDVPSFLAGVYAPGVTEDPLIQHDRETFGLWQLVRRFQVGAVQFVRDNQMLTVVTANRTRLERALGVDLIYWHHKYRAFTMVQYKRMVKESRGRDVYRPSGSYEEEIERMREVRRKTSTVESYSLCTEYRLSENPFFFKLCKLSEFNPNDQSLVPGMYIPLDYWETLLASDGLTGPRGGKVVSYDNVGRHLNNTEFISLVQSGWVGSSGVATLKLEEFVDQALSCGRAVEFAWSRGKRGSTHSGRPGRVFGRAKNL